MKKSCLVILDANVVINAHLQNYWKPLITGYKIHLPATVLRDEVQYFEDHKGKKIINLTEAVSNGSITELEATIKEDHILQTSIKPTFFSAFDPGEREALALLKSPRCKDFLFCTGDGLAIKGLSILGMTDRGISVEKLLKDVGHNKQLKHEFTEKFFKEQTVKGFQDKHLWAIL